MAAMEGIIIALVGLGIVIVASVSFVYPLPGLTTNRGRGWTVGVGYCVLFWGSTIIRQTVPEELREPFDGPITFVVLGMFVLSCIALIRPSPNLWLSTRKQAGYVCGLSLGLMAVAAQIAPEPPPPTPEELAAIAAEEKREAEEAKARRKAEEEGRRISEAAAEIERRTEERERGVREIEARKAAIQEWGEEHLSDAERHCEDRIEQHAEADFEWTTGWGDSIFQAWTAMDLTNTEKKNPVITESTILLYTGDKIRFQNSFGVFRNQKYGCSYHPDSKTVINVMVAPGRFID